MRCPEGQSADPIVAMIRRILESEAEAWTG